MTKIYNRLKKEFNTYDWFKECDKETQEAILEHHETSENIYNNPVTHCLINIIIGDAGKQEVLQSMSEYDRFNKRLVYDCCMDKAVKLLQERGWR